MNGGKQTLDFSSAKTLLSKRVLSKGLDIEKFERFGIGCYPTNCDIFDLIMMDGIVCKDLCYINESHINKIHNHLIINR